MEHADIFGKWRRLHAERTTDMTSQDANLFRFDLENLRHVAPHADRGVGGRVEREASARGVMDSDGRARLHRAYNDTTIAELEAGDVRGLVEGGGYLCAVAEVIVERDIAGRFVMDERRARTRRFLRPDHGRQRIDVDLD